MITNLEYAMEYGEDMFTGEPNDFMRRAEEVAERHLRTASPEFAAWLGGQLSPKDQAALVAALFSKDASETRRCMRYIADDWRDYARTNPRELRADIAREP